MIKVFCIMCVVFVAIKNGYTQDFPFTKNNKTNSGAPIITPDMVKNCDEELGYCEDMPDYPKAFIDKIIQENGGLLPPGPHEPEQTTRRRIKGHDEPAYTKICVADKHVIEPRAVFNKESGRWNWVASSSKYEIELCKSLTQPCVGVTTQAGYTSECEQLFMWTQFMVVKEGKSNISNARHKIPSCCDCKARCSA